MLLSYQSYNQRVWEHDLHCGIDKLWCLCKTYFVLFLTMLTVYSKLNDKDNSVAYVIPRFY